MKYDLNIVMDYAEKKLGSDIPVRALAIQMDVVPGFDELIIKTDGGVYRGLIFIHKEDGVQISDLMCEHVVDGSKTKLGLAGGKDEN